MPELTDVAVWRRFEFEWVFGIIENTTDLYIEKKRIGNNDNNGNIVFGEEEVVDRIILKDAKKDIDLVTWENSLSNKYRWFLQFNMDSDVIRPLIEHIATPLIDINNINNDIS